MLMMTGIFSYFVTRPILLLLLVTSPTRHEVVNTNPDHQQGPDDCNCTLWNSTVGEANALYQRILEKSDARFRPNVFGSPVEIGIDVFINNIGPIDTNAMSYDVDMFLRQRWVDERLMYNSSSTSRLYLPVAYHHLIWTPDTYFPNALFGFEPSITVPNRAITLHQDGQVFYSTRVVVKVTCYMDLTLYPHDKQKCRLKMASYMYHLSEVRFSWRNIAQPVQLPEYLRDQAEYYVTNVTTGVCAEEFNTDMYHLSEVRFSWRNIAQPVQLPEYLRDQAEYYVTNVTTGVCAEEFNTGSFACIEAVFHVNRLVSYFLLHVYLTSIMIVGLSWLNFWLDKGAAPARVALGITAILTMTTQLVTSKSSLLRVSYLKALDVWYTVCMVFVVLTLVEYAFIGNYWQRHLAEMERTGTKEQTSAPGTLACRIDNVSRILFPALFTVFNIMYWCYYLLQPGI